MGESEGFESVELLDHVLVPIAHADDAIRTAKALKPYQPTQVTALHIIEKGEGVPDKTPVEQSEEIASEAFEAFREEFPEALEKKAYARDIVQTIYDVAAEIEASAIAFRSRGGHRIMHFLSGDLTLKLTTGADRPIICLPSIELNE